MPLFDMEFRKVNGGREWVFKNWYAIPLLILLLPFVFIALCIISFGQWLESKMWR